MIIVDDYSTDNTIDRIEPYLIKDSRIRLIRLSENRGPAVARNTAISKSTGTYLAFLDGDDMWMPEKLEKQLRFMQAENISFSFTKYVEIKENGEMTDVIVDVPKTVNYSELLKQNVIGCLTVMLDKDAVGEVEMVNIRSRQDYVLWLSLCKKGITAYGYEEVLAKYRVVSNSVSRNKIKMAKQNWYVYRKIENLSLLKSFWYFLHYVYFKLRKLWL